MPGFLPGTRQEYGGIIRHGAKLLFAFAEATVPRSRSSHGRPRRRLLRHVQQAYPDGCEPGVAYGRNCGDGAEGAVNILYKRELDAPADPDAAGGARGGVPREVRQPVVAASRGFIDEVIHPRQTRGKLIAALAGLETKRDRNPPRSTGTSCCDIAPDVRAVKVLIANRGEIAVRIIRACREMGLDRRRLFRLRPGRAPCARRGHRRSHWRNEARSSYLNIDAILGAAVPAPTPCIRGTGSSLRTPLSPGRALDRPDVHRALGRRDCLDGQQDGGANRGAGREYRSSRGPRRRGRRARAKPSSRRRRAVGFPLMVKAVAGGGGKGMRVVESPARLLSAVQTARSEAGSASAMRRSISSA